MAMPKSRGLSCFSPTAMLSLVACALAVLAPLASAAPGCLLGQVWDDSLGRCQQCPYTTVKAPDEIGSEVATCVSARLVCGTAEVAQYGSCAKCPAAQVARDDVTCGDCPPGYSKVPYGLVSDAACKRTCVPQAEVCNGKDDDCDGLIDEDLGSVTCGLGECRRTVPACIKGVPQACRPGAAKVETCNGKDDDCDGQVDEGLGTISCGKGACANTVDRCVAGKTQTCKPKPSSKEVCDGIDNDCDGLVDENLGNLFCTPCNINQPKCVNGLVKSCAGVCDLPCCEDCHLFRDQGDPAAATACFSKCQGCRELSKCVKWADDVADTVAGLACMKVAMQCGISIGGTDGGRQGTLLQCYYAAYDTCTSRGMYYAQHATTGLCASYSIGGGTCSAGDFQALFEQELNNQCNDISIDTVNALP